MAATAEAETPLKRHLEETGRKQTWLVGVTGIQRSRLNRIVSGRYLPDVAEARAICTALDLEPSALGWSTDPENDSGRGVLHHAPAEN